MKRRFGLKLLLLWCFVPLTSSTFANLRLPAIVGNNMILQQQMGAPVWGWADPGQTITVAGSWGKEASATADDNEKWKVCLDTPQYGGPYTLTIKGKNEITIDNVMIGEVWLCAGQSNMGWRLLYSRVEPVHAGYRGHMLGRLLLLRPKTASRTPNPGWHRAATLCRNAY